MKDLYGRWAMGLLILLLVLVAVDIYLRVMQPPNQGPCLAIPTKFILQEPECAEKLIEAANVSNVRIVSSEALGTAPHNQSPILANG
jgi:hypothetical protein